MSVALKCDLCKNFFQVESTYIPNVLTFSRIKTGDDLNFEHNVLFVPDDKIIENACSCSRGAYIFNMCEQCYKKIEKMIVDDGGSQ